MAMKRLREVRCLLFVMLLTYFSCQAQSSNPIVYVYDELGRLVGVTDQNSDTVRYTYDAVGNILSISRYSSAQLSIIRFDPGSGPIGSQVTISGTGFSATPGENIVQFNGAIASVSSASATQLSVTVPNGATTGPLSVTTAASAATSLNSFTITDSGALPAITSFSPSIGLAGTAVSVTGNNFDSVLNNNELSFNISRARASSGTTTSLAVAVPSPATSGHIAIRTPAGKAASSDYFFVPPPPYSVSSVQYTGHIAIGGQSNVAINTASSIGLLVFDGTQGQGISVTAAGGTFGSCNLSVSVLTPTGAVLGSQSCMGSSGLLGSLQLPITGTYTIMFVPSSSATGAVTVNLYNAPDIVGTITPGGPSVTSTVAVPGQRVRLSFPGAYQQVVSTSIVGLGGGFFTTSIINPDGTTLASNGWTTQGSFIGVLLPVTGTYQILIAPANGVSGSVTTSLVSQTSNSTINFNTPVTNTVSSGVLTAVSFSGTSGQVISAEATGLNGFFMLYVLNPDGSQLGSVGATGGGAVVGKTLATTGTYQMVIVPSNGVSGSVSMSLVSQTTNGSITFNTPVTSTVSSGALTAVSFSGTSGQVISAEATGLNGIFTMYVLNPDGSQLGSVGATGGGAVVGKTLATTGTYQMVIVPSNGVSGSVTISVVSQTTNSTINFNTPVSSTVSSGALTAVSFSGTSGQVISTEATGLNGTFSLYVLNPNGSILGSSAGTGTVTVIGKTLSTTGTSEIVIVPNNGVSGSVTISVVSQTTNSTINFNTPVTSTINSSSLIGLSFSGTGGQTVSVQITPSFSGGTFAAYLLNPNGSVLSVTASTGSVSFSGKILGSTGTYQILIAPNNGVMGSASTSLTSP
jgi:YD repeat-containing protein